MESTSVASKLYDPEVNAAFPARPYLEQFKDPKTDPTKCQIQFLEGFHTLYEKYVRGSSNSKSLLEFGGGPALFTLISAAQHVDNITFAEYAKTNRDEIVMWKDEKSERYDWSKFIEYVVRELEGNTTEGAVERREKELREKIKDIIPCDASKFDSFFEEEYQSRQYDIVQSSRCFESVLDTREAYQQAIVKLASYVKPGGYLQILTAIGANWYSCAGVDYNLYALKVEVEDVLKGIEMAGLSLLETRTVKREQCPVWSTNSLQFTIAQKKQ